ncbi:MAG TPA: hypothetical protein VHI71_09730 [Actinomycetota bacterium]|nr:hypothetical protein [Actinomycetota bacterium]
MSRRAVVARTAAEVTAVAVLGLLHATAAGAVVLTGVALTSPGVVAVDGAGDAAAQAVAFGLACLRVPLESGDLRGTFAPLSGLAVTLWGLGAAVRKQASGWRGPPAAHVGAVASAFAVVCAVAAAAAGAAEAEASIGGAALAGGTWGAVAAAWAVGVPRRAAESRGPAEPRPPLDRLAERVRHARRRLESFGPLAAPGLAALAIALALAAAWFFAAVLLRVAGLPVRGAAGGLLLGAAVAPNAAAALVAVAVGGRIDVVLDGTALTDSVAASVSLWDWGGGIAPPHVLLLVLAPVAGVLAGGRAAATAAPRDHVLLRGLRLGAVMGAGVVAAGWAGSFAATTGGAGEVSVRLGFEPFPVFALALGWGVAGAVVGPRLPRPRSGPRVSR